MSHVRHCNPASFASFEVQDYDLEATLNSGQAFRWQQQGRAWVGVVANRWVRLQADHRSIHAEAVEPALDWHWLTYYLQLDLPLEEVLRTFPQEEQMRTAVRACHGLRLLRQEPWECLASFILSSTKQIVQIRQIVSLLCERFGDPLRVLPGHPPAFSFPSSTRLATLRESDLRDCRMGFRAPYLLETSKRVADGQVDLAQLHLLPIESARRALMDLPGVGRKIADCVLLFACGFQAAFPVDIWVTKALHRLYFPRQQQSVSLKHLHRFAVNHFGPNAGYAQQYLFHYMRTKPLPST